MLICYELFQHASEEKNISVFDKLSNAVVEGSFDSQKYIFAMEIGSCGKRIFLVSSKVCQ